MNLAGVQQAPHRHRARVWGAAAGNGQFAGALPIADGGAEPRLGHRAGAWTGLTEEVMVSTCRTHPGGVLAITDKRPHGREPRLQHPLAQHRCPHGGGAPRHHQRPPGRQPAQRPTDVQPATDYQGLPGYRPAWYLQRLLARHRRNPAGRWSVRHRGTVQQQPNQQQTRRRPAA